MNGGCSLKVVASHSRGMPTFYSSSTTILLVQPIVSVDNL